MSCLHIPNYFDKQLRGYCRTGSTWNLVTTDTSGTTFLCGKHSVIIGSAGSLARYGCTNETACNYNSTATIDDGACSYIPAGECDCNGNTLDECGVCGGNDSTCADACGVPNGDDSTCADACGVPNGDNSTCLDACGVPNGNNATCEDACGVPNGDGSTCADACGVPNGDGSTCADACGSEWR